MNWDELAEWINCPFDVPRVEPNPYWESERTLRFRELRSDLRFAPLRSTSRLMPLTCRETHETMPVMQQARARLSILFIAYERCVSV